MQDLKKHLDSRLDRIEGKIDQHLERISKAEESISWIKGHIKLGASLLVAVLSGMAGAIYHFMIKG